MHSVQGLRPDLARKTDARLREIDFGRWEGQRWDAINGLPVIRCQPNAKASKVSLEALLKLEQLAQTELPMRYAGHPV